MILLKSIYADPVPEDGTRILVMRRWPRGVRKDRVDEWWRDLSPSEALLRDYRAKKVSLARFFERYREEMADRRDLIRKLAERSKSGTLTLLCWEERDEDCHRHVLKSLVEEAGGPGRKRRSRP